MAIVVVGGALEALNSDKTEVRLVINRRKGFIKLAMKYGRSIVPTFTFGENTTYNQMPNPEGSRLRKFQVREKLDDDLT